MQKLLGKELFDKIEKIASFNSITEIRLRLGKRIFIKLFDSVLFIDEVANDDLMSNILFVATNGSMYAYESQISEGYIDYLDGIRIGICGDCVCCDDKRISIKKIYSICIRFPHEILGCANGLGEMLLKFESTLIISPPGCGKTTLLREITRKLSDRYDVFVIDEREEIFGKGLILKRGERCDVIQGVPKSLAYERAIRTMSPDIIVCDELFGVNDESAVKDITRSGVKILATYHSDNYDVSFADEIFSNKILLSSYPHVGSIKSIIKNGKSIS